MGFYVFASWGGAPDNVLPGEDLPLHLPIDRYGSAADMPVESVRVSVYRIDPNNGSRIFAVDRDGVTVNAVSVTQTDGHSDVYMYMYKTPSDAVKAMYYVHWQVKIDGRNLNPIMDRFRVDVRPTAGQAVGNVEFVGIDPVS